MHHLRHIADAIGQIQLRKRATAHSAVATEEAMNEAGYRIPAGHPQGRQTMRPLYHDPCSLALAALRTAQAHQFAEMCRARLLEVQDHVDRTLHLFLAQRVAGFATELVFDGPAALVE
jgi:hypothetical protein